MGLIFENTLDNLDVPKKKTELESTPRTAEEMIVLIKYWEGKRNDPTYAGNVEANIRSLRDELERKQQLDKESQE